ncbi:hypothetical protein BEN47_15195 [Hymenobacter lapidarius]|uniref:Outer membrane protein beta-barrel domain-containing protein n=1 Tax=Hymenobacter lapidarius TaxID=1908237 RepID=A0A1G1T361_9BACT|nr:hypothetical protein [Hymenobacter lapidarius]OGX85302.1 hypothetical protein BEN47_15195 [Hymenobacter lapidarius]
MKQFYSLLMALPIALTLSAARAQGSPQAETLGTNAAASAVRRPAMVRLGVGESVNGSGDYSMLKTFIEYAPQVGRHCRLGSRLAYIGGSQPSDFGYGFVVPRSYRALNLEQEVYWLPFGLNKTVEFSLGAGAFVGYSKQKGFSQGGFNTADLNGNQSFSYVPANEKGFNVGYIGSLNVDFALNAARTWRLGGRLALQNDTRANILPGGQFQLSRAL